jgi:hypothetical protein
MDVVRVIAEDAIPSIDDPSFGPDFGGSPTDRVVVPDIDGQEWRAYPLRILNYHEIVNDRLGDLPVAVTWCPLCGTIVVYDRRVGDQTLTFGVSGKLADDNLVMYDRETGSEWKQSLGTAIAGPLEGESLQAVPAAVTTWDRYRDIVGSPAVLSETAMESEAASETNTPARIDYDRDPYRRYFDASGFGLAAHRNQPDARTWDRSDLDPKTPVIGIGERPAAVAVPRPWIPDERGVVRVEGGGTAAVVFGAESGLFAYADPGLEFDQGSGDRFRADGTLWDAVTGESEDGRELDRLPARREFAFTWQDDHGPDRFAPDPL